MAHSSTNLLVHIIFSTKDRRRHIDKEIQHEVHAYLGGIIRELGAKPLAVGGTADHVHILIQLPADKPVADVLRVMKTNSSRWIHKKWPGRRSFSWQTGYGAFSVSQSNVPAVLKYIANQEAHHRKISFQEEFLAFLKKHGIPFDERYIWT